MFTKVSVLVPTRHRIERLRTLLDSYERTVVGAEDASELVFKVDSDDLGTYAFLHGQHSLAFSSRGKGYDDMASFFNEMATLSSGDVIMLGNDDMVFQTPHWAPAILEVANRYPDGLFDIGVSTLNETHYPFATISRYAAGVLGFAWDPRVFWGDIFWRDVMAHFCRLVMVPSVRIDHDWAGNNPDQVFLEGDRNIVARNPTYWTETHAPAVREAVAKLEAARKVVA